MIMWRSMTARRTLNYPRVKEWSARACIERCHHQLSRPSSYQSWSSHQNTLKILSPKHFPKVRERKNNFVRWLLQQWFVCWTLHFLCGIFHPKQKRTLQPCKEKYSTAHSAQSGSSYTSPLWILIHGLDVRLYSYWQSMFIILIGHQLATTPRNPVQSHFYFSTRAVLHLSIRRCYQHWGIHPPQSRTISLIAPLCFICL